MRILADSLGRFNEFAPAGVSGERVCRTDLENIEQQLWQTLTNESLVWMADCDANQRPSFWRHLLVINEAPESQFDALHRALVDGLCVDGPVAALALCGRGFRGQRGRAWSALSGNLFLTAVLPINVQAPDVGHGLTMLPAIAVVEAIRSHGHGGPAPTIKWVNDILIGGRKVAGVLTASLCHANVLETAILGIGVNVAQAPDIAPTPFVHMAGCLKDDGYDVSLADFMWTVLDRLAKRYRELFEESPAGLYDAYRRASCIIGRRVRIWPEPFEPTTPGGVSPRPIAAGVVQSIEPDLSLNIDGCVSAIPRGRLAFEEDCRALGL